MKLLSLFSGVGGFDRGLEAAGMETVALCEWDRHAQSVLRRHWPNTPLYGDVSELTGAQLIADGVRPDVVAFGSPCQDLSVAGKRAGLQGERSGLFHEAVRIIRELRDLTDGTLPRWVIWENVVGALNSNGGADFQAVLDEMGNLGAHLIEWAVLDAQNYGVPQRRRRVFLVSCLDPRTSAQCPDPLLPVGEGSARDLAPLREAWKNSPAGARGRASGAIARALGFGAYSIDDRTGTLKTRGNHADIDYALIDGTRVDDVRVYEEPVQTLKARMGTGGNTVPLVAVPETTEPLLARDGKGIGTTEATTKLIAYAIPIHDQATRHEGKDGRGKGNGLGIGDENDPMNTLTTADRHAVAYGFSHTQGLDPQVSQDHWPTLRREGGGHAVAYGFDEYNGTTDDIHNTLRAGTKQSTGTMIGSVVRRLTPRECERLMGWPDDWTRWTDDGREQADSHRYKQIGNGVASPVAFWVGRQIFAAEHLA